MKSNKEQTNITIFRVNEKLKSDNYMGSNREKSNIAMISITDDPVSLQISQ